MKTAHIYMVGQIKGHHFTFLLAVTIECIYQMALLLDVVYMCNLAHPEHYSKFATDNV